MGVGINTIQGEDALCLLDLPNACDSRLQFLVLVGVQWLGDFDLDFDALPLSSLLPEASHYPIDEDEGQVADGAARTS